MHLWQKRIIPQVTIWTVLVFMVSFWSCAPDPLEIDPIGPTNDWKLFYPNPGGYDLNAVWGQTPEDVWAVGIYGTIVHWDGEEVQSVDSPTNGLLNFLDGHASNDIYAAGAKILLHYDGRSWEVEKEFPDHIIMGILCAKDGTLYITGTMGLWCKRDSGWQEVEGPSGSSQPIWYGSDGIIRVGDSNVVWLVDGCYATQEASFHDSRVVLGSGGLILCEEGVYVYRLYEYQNTAGWVAIESFGFPIYDILDTPLYLRASWWGIYEEMRLVWGKEFPRRIHDMKRCGAGGVLACGFGGTLLYGVRGDSDYTWIESGQTVGYRDINMITGTSCENIWAGENRGSVLHFDGSAWTRQSPFWDYTEPISDIQALDDGALVVSCSGMIQVRDPEGNWSWPSNSGFFLRRFFAFSPDSIVASSRSGFHLWDGIEWSDKGEFEGTANGFSSMASGEVFTLISGENTILSQWTGAGFDAVVEMPGTKFLELCGSRESDTIWIGGMQNPNSQYSQVFRYREGVLEDVTGGARLPVPIMEMTELSPGRLFVLAGREVWELKDGHWSRETGLPSDDFFRTIWSHPDCGVFVQGHPTFFKEFSQE